MNDNIKVALILAATVIICVGLWIYFSPFHTCMRDGTWSAIACSRAAAGGG